MLRLASYNLHKCRGLTGPHAPERNLAVIRALAPDIIALQEVDFRLGTRPEALPRAMIERETGLIPAEFNGTGGNSLGWHGQTILMRPELARTATLRRLPLPGLEPRGAIALRLPELTVVGLHLGLARSSRRAQLARISEKLRRLPSEHAVMMGDFNEWRDDRGFEPIEDFRILAPGPSYPAPLPRLKLDRFAVTPGIEIKNSGVFTEKYAPEASDHLPIWVDIQLPGT